MGTLSKEANAARDEARDGKDVSHGAIYTTQGLIKCECGRVWNFDSELARTSTDHRNEMFEDSQRHFDVNAKFDKYGNHPAILNKGLNRSASKE
jgi:hypothetical protein